jgi:hypothetical protein
MKMSIWGAANISDQPEVTLTQWQIFEVSSEHYPGERTCHFCGYNVVDFEGRVSSKIISFDSKRMVGKTNSGRIYKLEGKSGRNSNASYVWANFCAHLKASAVRDITDEYDPEYTLS